MTVDRAGVAAEGRFAATGVRMATGLTVGVHHDAPDADPVSRTTTCPPTPPLNVDAAFHSAGPTSPATPRSVMAEHVGFVTTTSAI